MIHEIKPSLSTTIYILKNANVSTNKATEDFIELIKREIASMTPSINQKL